MGLLQFLQGAERQINPLDNGRTFKNKQGNGQNKSAAAQALGLGKGVAGAAIAPFSWLAKTDIVQPTKELAASLTGNKQASTNAVRSSNVNLGLGPEGNDLAGGLKTFGGNTAQVALSFLAPGAGKVVAPAVEKAGLTGAAAKLATAGGTGAVVGAPFGAASEVANNPHLTPEDILKGAALGGVAGAGLGVAGEGLHLAAEHAQPLNEVGGVHNNPKNPVNNQDTFHVPVGGGNFLEVSKEEMSALQKAKTPEEVKKVIGDALPPTVTDKLAPGVALAKDPNIIANLFARELTPKTGPVLPEQPTAQTPQDINSATFPVTEPSPTPNPTTADNNAALIIKGLRGTEQKGQQQAALYTSERATRAARATAAGSDIGGSEGYQTELSRLQGPLEKVKYNGLSKTLKPQDQEDLFRNMRTDLQKDPSLDFYKYLNTQTALRKVIFGEGLPTKSERALLRERYGQDFGDTLDKSVSDHQQQANSLLHAGGQVLGLPRELVASGDISGLGRQALSAFTSHPILTGKNFLNQIKFYKKDNFDASEAEIASRPNFSRALSAKLAILDPEKTDPSGAEEKFVSHLGEKIPGIGRLIKGSNRSFTGTLNRIRMDIFDHLIGRADNAGYNIDDPKLLKDLAHVVNNSTGRGEYGEFLQKHAGAMSSVFFSPRLMASRINTFALPFYKNLSRPARLEAWRQLASLGTFAVTTLELAKMAGAKVSTDPTNADFGKAKFGDTRVDMLGGFSQYIRLGAQLAEGKITSSTTGAVQTLDSGFGKKTAYDVLRNFFENKENPTLSFVTTELKGKDISGNDVRTPKGLGGQLLQRAIPLAYQDINDLFRHPNAVKGSIPGKIAASAGTLAGVGLQTYGLSDINISDKQKAYVAKLKDKGQQQAYTNFLQTRKVASGTKTNADDAIKAAIKSGQIDQAVKLAKDYNQQYVKSFDDWRKQYGKYRNDEALQKAFNKYLITDKTFTTWINNSKKGATP